MYLNGLEKYFKTNSIINGEIENFAQKNKDGLRPIEKALLLSEEKDVLNLNSDQWDYLIKKTNRDIPIIYAIAMNNNICKKITHKTWNYLINNTEINIFNDINKMLKIEYKIEEVLLNLPQELIPTFIKKINFEKYEYDFFKMIAEPNYSIDARNIKLILLKEKNILSLIEKIKTGLGLNWILENYNKIKDVDNSFNINEKIKNIDIKEFNHSLISSTSIFHLLSTNLIDKNVINDLNKESIEKIVKNTNWKADQGYGCTNLQSIFCSNFYLKLSEENLIQIINNSNKGNQDEIELAINKNMKFSDMVIESLIKKFGISKENANLFLEKKDELSWSKEIKEKIELNIKIKEISQINFDSNLKEKLESLLKLNEKLEVKKRKNLI